MKKTIFLVLVGASFALCNCQQQTTPATIEAPVAPPPIKVTAEKNEITPVTIGGGLAPSSVKGKTIVFKFPDGTSPVECHFTSINHVRIDKKGRTVIKDIDGMDSGLYTKTSSTTAEVENRGSDGGELYILTFNTPTSGTAIRKYLDVDYKPEKEINKVGITFTIK